MRNSSISHEKKIEAVERYKRGEANQKSIAREYGVDESSFRQ
jgi:transposase-like protein